MTKVEKAVVNELVSQMEQASKLVWNAKTGVYTAADPEALKKSIALLRKTLSSPVEVQDELGLSSDK
jgi:hypothetical protein